MRCRRVLALLAVRAVVLGPWLGYPPFRPAIVCKPHRSFFLPLCPFFVFGALDLRFCRGQAAAVCGHVGSLLRAVSGLAYRVDCCCFFTSASFTLLKPC